MADTDAVPDASRISPPVLLPGAPNPVRLDLRAVFAGGAPAGVASSLHAVASGDGVVALRPGERLNRDVILRWPAPAGDSDGPAADASSPRVSLDVTPDGPGDAGSGLDGDGTFTLRLTAPPAAGAEPPSPRDVVVLLDRSGSMSGWKMAAARRAAARIVDCLGPADRFTVLAFDDAIERPHHLPAQLIEATDRNRWLAVEWLAGVDARGGTELWPALADAFRLLATPPLLGPLPASPPPPMASADGSQPADSGEGSAELPPALWYRWPPEVALEARRATCLLVTDGQVGNEDQILAELGRPLGRAQVFTVGIDQAVNVGFLRRLAAAGGGRCELVESEDRLDEAMGAIHRRIAEAPLRSVSVQAEAGSEVLHLAPAGPVDCFTGVPLVIRGRYRGSVPTIRWSATRPDGSPCGGVVSVGAPVPQSATTLVRRHAALPLWARARIRDLEDHLARNRFGGAPAGAADEIVALSLATGVLSRFTAFVAVDLSETVDGTSPRPVVQPVERPAGWAGALPPVGAMPMPAMSLHAAAPAPAGRGATPPSPGAAPPAPPMMAPADLQAAPSPASTESLRKSDGGQPPVRRLADRLRRNLTGGGPPPPSVPGPVPLAPPAPPAAPGPDLARYAQRLEALVARIEEGERGSGLVLDLDELLDDLVSVGAPTAAVDAVRSLRDAVAAGAVPAEVVAAARAALAPGQPGRGPSAAPAPTPVAPPPSPRPDFWR